MPSWILAIDFGTSYTVAASKVGDRSPEVIEVGGERRIPSVVMVDEAMRIVVGRTADDLSGTHPGSTLRALKNRLGDQAPVVLDGRPYQVVNLVAALLKQVYQESVRQLGSPPTEVRLTHPATWNRPRLNRLLEAAAKAELPQPALVPEPVAAALSFASEVGVASGSHVAVYDLGGGTFDSAVVTASGGGFNIVGRPGGDQNIGGELFDEIIVNHLGEQLPPTAWEAIQIGEQPLWQQVGATLRNEARKAKETLSGNPYADLIVPLPTGLQQIRLTREEFEDMVRPYIAETVVLLERCVSEAGLDADGLSGISLVGGSSRSPIVEEMVKHAFPTVPVIRRGDPKTAVASGAARAVRSSVAAPPVTTGQATQEAAPGTAPQAVRLAPPISNPPAAPGLAAASATVSAGGGPVSAPPAVTSPTVQPDAPAAATGAPTTGAATPTPPQPPPPPDRGEPIGPSPSPVPRALATSADIAPATPSLTAGDEPEKRSSNKALVIVGVIVVALLAVGGILFATRSDSSAGGLPTRKSIVAALLPIRTVRAELGDEWNEEDNIAAGDPFCEQFGLTEPTRQGERLFLTTTTSDTSAERGFYQAIGAFDSAQAASTFFEQDKKITENCESSEGTVGGVPVTYTITDASDEADKLGRDVLAIKYEASPADGSGGVLLTGYVVEAIDGLIVMSTNGYVYNDTVADGDVSEFFDLTKAAFDRADEEL